MAVLVGRTDAPAGTDDGGLTQEEAVLDALGGLDVPIVLDVEIGHVPPHLPLLNGAVARVVVDGDRHEITQTWPVGRSDVRLSALSRSTVTIRASWSSVAGGHRGRGRRS